jgi:hypothetical protein
VFVWVGLLFRLVRMCGAARSRCGASKAMESPTACRRAAQVAELVRSTIDALVAVGPEFVLQTAVGASHTIPIAMIAINIGPIARGYCRALPRPAAM